VGERKLTACALLALLMILLQDPTFTSTILHATDLGN